MLEASLKTEQEYGHGKREAREMYRRPEYPKQSFKEQSEILQKDERKVRF